MTREEIEAALAILDRPAVGIAPSYWTSRLPESVTEQALRALLRALPVLTEVRLQEFDHRQIVGEECDCDMCVAIREYDRQEEKPCE